MRGWIEAGRHRDAGFLVRAMDNGGFVFEDDQPWTFAEAMAALEKGRFSADGLLVLP